jgi:hypothetical protein
MCACVPGSPLLRYTGEWKGGQRHGKGKLIFASGGYIEGIFQNGEISGPGYREWANGDSYSGIFEVSPIHQCVFCVTLRG